MASIALAQGKPLLYGLSSRLSSQRETRMSRAVASTTVLATLGGLLAACGGTVDQTPDEMVPALAVTGSIKWDSKSQMKQIASTKGCDSWTPTWAPDNNLYTAFSDCRMRGIPQKVGMGYGRISG